MQYYIIYIIISIHVLLLHSWYISVEIVGMCGELVISSVLPLALDGF